MVGERDNVDVLFSYGLREGLCMNEECEDGLLIEFEIW